MSKIMNKLSELWFDVGVKRYTTQANYMCYKHSCGLMQESKDIQLERFLSARIERCGLMQESKDIQPSTNIKQEGKGCGLMQESKDIQHARYSIYHQQVVV